MFGGEDQDFCATMYEDLSKKFILVQSGEKVGSICVTSFMNVPFRGDKNPYCFGLEDLQSNYSSPWLLKDSWQIK